MSETSPDHISEDPEQEGVIAWFTEHVHDPSIPFTVKGTTELSVSDVATEIRQGSVQGKEWLIALSILQELHGPKSSTIDVVSKFEEGRARLNALIGDTSSQPPPVPVPEETDPEASA